MQSTFGKNIRVSIWGGSHEPAIGVDIEGIPVGTRIDMNQLRAFLQRRAPGNSPFATKRKEPDLPIPVAGIAAWAAERRQNRRAIQGKRIPVQAISLRAIPPGSQAIQAPLRKRRLLSRPRLSSPSRSATPIPAPGTTKDCGQCQGQVTLTTQHGFAMETH